MKKKFLFFIITCLLSISCVAQKGVLVLNQSTKIDTLILKQRQIHVNDSTIDGFRVQIFMELGNDALRHADSVKQVFSKNYPDVPVYLIFGQPYYRLRIGDFRTRLEAERMYQMVKKSYKNAFVTADRINLPYIALCSNVIDWKTIKKEEIVLDDVVYISSGDSILTDLEVLKSSSLEVDESIITGESDAIIKKKDDKIMSGSIVTSGSGYAKVISIGKNSYASNLIKEASEVSDNSSYLQRTINTILKIVTVLIIPVGILLFISQYFHSNQTYSEAILSTVAGIIGMIPEGLVLLTSIALTAGVIKMAKKNVIIQKLHGIEVLSCTDVLCLDKTGTITDGTMTVVDTIVLDKRVNIANIIANINTEEGNNSTDIALKNKYGIKNDLNVTDRVPFSSAKKCSITTIDNTKYYLGALEYITDKQITDYEELDKYIQKGYRIITLAREKDKIEVLAFIIIKDNIRPSAGDTLKYFKEQGVEIKIISGDNPISVSNILKQLDFEGYDKFIAGPDLPKDYEELVKVAHEKVIFGRMTPSQKQMVIKALKEDNTVSMIGDGVNDVLGLKEADCGIALQSGVNAARSVSEVVLTTSDFSVLPDIVNEGRRVVNNIERVAAMYLIKTTYSFLLSLLSIVFSGTSAGCVSSGKSRFAVKSSRAPLNSNRIGHFCFSASRFT